MDVFSIHLPRRRHRARILFLREKLRLGGEIRTRIGMRRMRPHIRSLFHDLPRLHDDDAICKLPRERNVVRDEEEGDARAVSEMPQVVCDHLPDGGVKPLRRLIREDILRLTRICHRTEDALQHPARELMRIGGEDTLRISKTEPREERLVLRPLPRRTPRAAPHICDLPSDAVHGAECRTRQLWDDAPQLPPVMTAQLLLTERSDIHPVEQDPPRNLRSRRQRTEERLAERGFPAAALSDDRRHPTDGEVCTDIGERSHVCISIGIAHGQIAHGKSFFLHHPRTSCRTSKCRRSSCPTMLSELTRRTIAAPGTMMRCGAWR